MEKALNLVKRFLRNWVIPPKVFDAVQTQAGKKAQPERQFEEVGSRLLDSSDASIAAYQELRLATTNDVVWVPIEKVRAEASQALTLEQHHYVRFFSDGQESLTKYFLLHQPRNPMERLFLGEQGSAFEGQGLVDNRSPQSTRAVPWNSQAVILPGGANVSDLWSGPASESLVARESHRLERVRRSILRHGFWMPQVDPPAFYLLTRNSGEDFDFRVVLVGGNHRMAFLAHLGWSAVPLKPGLWAGEVRLSELEQWPGVLDGTFSQQEAVDAFMAFFRDPHEPLIPGW